MKIKRLISGVLAFSIVFSNLYYNEIGNINNYNVSAGETTIIDGFDVLLPPYYPEGTCCIEGYNGNETEITIPEILADCKVVSVKPSSFYGNVKNINIPKAGMIAESMDKLKDAIDAFYDIGVQVNIESYDFFDNSELFEDKEFEFSYYENGEYASDGSFSSNGYIVIDGINGTGTELFFPAEINGMPVKEIAIWGDSFANLENVERIVIPEGVESIHGNFTVWCNNPIIEFPSTIKDISCYLNGVDFIIPDEAPITHVPNDLENSNWYKNQSDGLIYWGDTLYKYKSENNSAVDDAVKIKQGTKRIYRSAFENCEFIKSLEIPESVTIIEDKAFKKCTNLEKINLPEKIKTIDKEVFSGCSKLKNISLPKNLVSIGGNAFNGCSCLTEVVLPDNLNKIDHYAFEECSSLRTVVFSENVNYIGAGVFKNCISLNEVEIPKDVKKIFERTFSGCLNLSELKVSEDLTEIGEEAFLGCNFEKVYMPAKVSLGENAFKNVPDSTKFFLNGTKEQAVSFKNNLKKSYSILGYMVDGSNVKLTYIRPLDDIYFIPQEMNGMRVTSIGSNAYDDAVQELYIPEYITELDKNSINVGSYSNHYIFVKKDSAAASYVKENKIKNSLYYNDEYNYAINDDNSATIIKYRKNDSTVIIPSEIEGLRVTSIGKKSFENHSDLDTIVIPDTIKSIEAAAFRGCSLNSVIIPDSVENIGDNTFDESNLKTIIFTDGTKTVKLGNHSLGSKIEKIVIPESVSKIENLNMNIDVYTVLDSYAYKYARDNNNTVWTYTENNGSITILSCSSSWKDRIKVPSEIAGVPVTSINEQAFQKCKEMKYLCIPDTLINIPENIFEAENMMQLDKIVAVCKKESMFEKLAKKKGININYLVGDYSFIITDSDELKINGYWGDVPVEIEIPGEIAGKKVSELGPDVFSEYSELKKVIIPKEIKVIDDYAFYRPIFETPKMEIHGYDNSRAEYFAREFKYKFVGIKEEIKVTEPVVTTAVTKPATTTETTVAATKPATTTETTVAVTKPATTTETTVAATKPATTTETTVAATKPVTTTETTVAATKPAITTVTTVAATKPETTTETKIDVTEESQITTSVSKVTTATVDKPVSKSEKIISVVKKAVKKLIKFFGR